MSTAMSPDPKRQSTAGSSPEAGAVRDRLNAIFDAALEMPRADREAFLVKECGDDAKLLADCETLNALPGASTT